MLELSKKSSKKYPRFNENESSEEEAAPGTGSSARRLYISARKKRKERVRILAKDKRLKNSESESGKALSLSSFRVAIVGSQGVGKSALAVRHVTNRFIGEYKPGEEMYHCKANKTAINYELLVQCSKISQETLSSLKRRTNGFLVIYDITSRDSFSYATQIVESLRNPEECFLEGGCSSQRVSKRYWKIPHNSMSEDEVFYENEFSRSPKKHGTAAGDTYADLMDFSCFSLPISLVGNKLDLEHRREILVEEAQNIALENDCNFIEVSAAESAVGPNLAIQMILREIFLMNKEASEDFRLPIIDQPRTEFNSESNRYSRPTQCRNDSEEIKYHFKEYANDSSLSSRSSSCSSHKSSSNYSSCSSSWRNFKTSSLKGPIKFKDWNGAQEPKGIFSDMKMTLENLFYSSVNRKSGRKHTNV